MTKSDSSMAGPTSSDRISGTRAVRDEDAFDVATVAAWLAGNATPDRTGIDLSALPEVRQFSGGVSNLTYLLAYPDGDLILRRPPKGSHHKGAHDMGREHRIQTQLGWFLPYVPRTVALCEDPSVIGTPFYVMERLAGPIPRKDLPRGVVLDREGAAALCRNVIDLLVDLHRVDLAATGLADLGKGDGYVRRQVEGWSERYRRARTWNVGSFERVMRWLADHQPADRPHTLVHNDFRFDNVVLDPEDPTRPVGLLDWELATVGDPLMDLASGLGYWIQAEDGPHMQAFRRQPTHLPGMMTREEVVAHYCARTGARVTRREWAWYQVFGLFRVAVIAQQVYQRYLSRQTTNKQFRFFGVAVVLLELRCRRIIAAAARMPAEAADAQVGSRP
ncbi:phosphotransferase family protein [Streptomyces sp. P17]|uniref:phosphotransferase family protein n=1 Tax=Streptomyces sp. P17 TaxID=3074716 RepID=UPI0028F43E3C|nr:phosphotransferase family protein [Streptomyces sp. P17]MDT9697942.1 phosphotransferase family protein [Streptomyces sp. P17]